VLAEFAPHKMNPSLLHVIIHQQFILAAHILQISGMKLPKEVLENAR